jgi:hypothetical protein
MRLVIGTDQYIDLQPAQLALDDNQVGRGPQGWLTNALGTIRRTMDYMRKSAGGDSRRETEAQRNTQLYQQAVRDHFLDQAASPMVQPTAAYTDPQTGAIFIIPNEIVVAFDVGLSHAQIASWIAQYRNAAYPSLRLATRRVIWDEERIYLLSHTDPASADSGAVAAQRGNVLAADLTRNHKPPITFACVNAASGYRKSGWPGPLPATETLRWHLMGGTPAGINAGAAWTLIQQTLPDPSEVVVAVMDDGFEIAHPALVHCFDTANGRDFYIDPSDAQGHRDPRPKVFKQPYNNNVYNDIHGTPCASLIAAFNSANNVFGVSPNCTLLPIKIFAGEFLVPVDKVIAAFAHAARHADAISCSWYCDEAIYKMALETVFVCLAEGRPYFRRRCKGVPVVCAAGNNGEKQPGQDGLVYPAKSCNHIASVIAVTATTQLGAAAPYSSRGKEVWVCAPGGAAPADQLSPLLVADVIPLPFVDVGLGFHRAGEAGDIRGDWTDQFFGTSAAAPVAAGVVALMLAANPELSLTEIREILRDSAQKIDPHGGGYAGEPKFSPKYGYGLVDARGAVRRALARREAAPMV